MSAKAHAIAIFRAALAAADPEAAVIRSASAWMPRIRNGKFERIYIVGAGKASAAMARGVEKLLKNRIAGGSLNVPEGTKAKLTRVALNPAGHPIPDARGVEGSLRIMQIVEEAGPRDLILCMISGGASALLPAPAPPLTLAGKQDLTRQLLWAGADIHELNTVRKHLSLIKGGQLAQLAKRATLIALILSDVIGDDFSVIGSGPTVPDGSTVEDARRILKKYGVAEPPGLHETPKQPFSNVTNLIVGNNRLALDAAAKEARALGYQVLLLASTIDGETRDIARMHAAIARERLGASKPVCILSGGETTVTVRGKGKGGRNQEFVLAAAMALSGEDVTIFSGGTDGIDGPTDAAGAIADARTWERVRKLGLDPQAYLNDNDAYHFFDRVKGLVKTGPTGTNVMDVRVLLLQ